MGLNVNEFPPSVAYLFGKQIYDDSTHEMQYVDEILRRGWAPTQRAAFRHPYCAFTPATRLAYFVFALRALTNYRQNIRIAALNLGAKVIELAWLERFGRDFPDARLRAIFAGQVPETRSHVLMGRLIVERCVDERGRRRPVPDRPRGGPPELPLRPRRDRRRRPRARRAGRRGRRSRRTERMGARDPPHPHRPRGLHRVPHVLRGLPRDRPQRGDDRSRSAAPLRDRHRPLSLPRLHGLPHVLPGPRLHRRGGERPLPGAAAPEVWTAERRVARRAS